VGTGAALRSGATPAHATPSVLSDGSIPDVAERVVDSVVNISTSHVIEAGPASFDPFFSNPFSPGFGDPGDRKAMSKGSGVIITASGRILTNAHVVKDADDIRVTLHDGNDYEAKVIGVDPKADLAVIQLKGNPPTLKPLTFGDSSVLRLGEVVLAIGDPFGVGKSVTMGIVSAKGRGGMGIEEYEDFIQTDAAINPGNSGGALVNLKGELVGINTAIASKSGGYAGIGFAIPTNMARPIMEQLIKDGKVSRGYLGVNIATVTPMLAKEQGLPAQHGALLAAIDPNGPAARSGLTEGDVVVALNGTEIKTSDVLRNTIAMIKPGTTVELQVIRKGGSKVALKARLGELPADSVVRGQKLRSQRLTPQKPHLRRQPSQQQPDQGAQP
ncbi:MAG TPA: trypsin-like peptidase domain-containing protein, partial [Kofleriaceae bacterium]|nr:trypsin-like peptidase domain-containing protein [Kofleriaceae bacterium]